MARRRNSNRRHRGSFGFFYKLLSMLVICVAIIVAITLFFKVKEISVSGQQRYTAEQIREATGILPGDNLYLLNKHEVAAGIVAELPYIEEIRINRDLPDTLVITVQECGTPLAFVQDGFTWLMSPKGKIVDQQDAAAAEDYAIVSGAQLLAPSIGTQIALATEYSAQQTSLLELLKALGDAGMLDQLDGIRLDDTQAICMEYADRFTVKMPYGADYAYKLRYLTAILESGKIQSNMTGTFDMTSEDGRTNFIQNVR